MSTTVVGSAQTDSGATQDVVLVNDAPRQIRNAENRADTWFRVICYVSGVTVLAIMVLVGLFLAIQGAGAIAKNGVWSFLTTQDWQPNEGHFGVAALLFGTVTIGIIAIIVALPLAFLTATFISEFAPAKLKPVLITTMDLMAAIPSVVYGLWGMFWLQDAIVPVAMWINRYFGWIPIFAVSGWDADNPFATPTVFTASSLLAGLVVAMMVTPIAGSIMREVFSQAPLGEREGAYALGANRWGMIKTVVYPFARGGVIGGTMLGLGRALGETVAVYRVISPVFVIQPHILEKGSNTISATIALRYGEASPFELTALMAAGLVLFLFTMALNFIAGYFVNHSRSGAAS